MMNRRRATGFGRRLWLATTVIMILIGLLGADDSLAQDYSRIVLIFVDVTNSLTPDELDEAIALTGQILDGLNKGDGFVLYPIHHDPERAALIADGGIPSSAFVDEVILYQKQVDELKVWLAGQLRTIFAEVNAEGAPDDRSCILNSFYVAEQILVQFPKADREIVYISDMVEECGTSPLGGAFSLDKPNIDQDLDRLKSIDKGDCGLGQIRFTAAIPVTAGSALVRSNRRPPLRDLRSFWGAVLSKCGFSDEELADPNRFYFAGGLPIRLKAGSR